MAFLNWKKEKFDLNNAEHRFSLTMGCYYLFSAFLNPAKYMVFWFALPTYMWFEEYPEDFIDSEGHVLPGWPEAVARVRDLMRMLVLDYDPFMRNMDGLELTLSKEDFGDAWLCMFINLWVGNLVEYIFGAIPFFAQSVFVFINLLVLFIGGAPKGTENYYAYLQERLTL